MPNNRTHPLAWLPNTHGFPFTAVKKDGTTARARVIKAPDGTYKVDGVDFKDLTGWRDV